MPKNTNSKHYLVLSVLGADHLGIAESITSSIIQCGCKIEKSNTNQAGQEFSGMFLLSGGWGQIAKMEAVLPWPRTEARFNDDGSTYSTT